MSWRPSYTNVAKHLSTPQLYAEILKLENSVKHLKRSNEELIRHGEESGEDAPWTEEVVRENEGVISKQEEMIEMCREEIIERGQTGHGEMEVEEERDGKVQGDEVSGNGNRGQGSEELGEDMDLDEEDGVHL